MPLSAHLLAYCYCNKDYSHERYVLSFSEDVLIDWVSLLGHQREKSNSTSEEQRNVLHEMRSSCKSLNFLKVIGNS